MSNEIQHREDFMSKRQQDQMRPAKGDKRSRIPRTHSECIARTGVARPGKTAKDRANRARSAV